MSIALYYPCRRRNLTHYRRPPPCRAPQPLALPPCVDLVSLRNPAEDNCRLVEPAGGDDHREGVGEGQVAYCGHVWTGQRITEIAGELRPAVAVHRLSLGVRCKEVPITS